MIRNNEQLTGMLGTLEMRVRSMEEEHLKLKHRVDRLEKQIKELETESIMVVPEWRRGHEE